MNCTNLIAYRTAFDATCAPFTHSHAAAALRRTAQGRIVSTCSCGKSYTTPEFEALQYVGYQCMIGLADYVPGELDLELRNCPCRSTISRYIECNHD